MARGLIEVAIRHWFRSGAGHPDLDLHFALPSAGITVLFGPSGAGKSSVVAALAGLLRPAEARIALDGQVLQETATRTWVPPEVRRIGVVFQDARLFPHLSVRGNLSYGMRRAPAGAISSRVVIELLGLEGLLPRRPHTLSGGERQRVAIGRALLAQPRLLIMDEPLASLDVARRQAIMPYLLALRRDLLVPIVYVTHQIAEMATLADHVVLLAGGRVTATGRVADLFARADLAFSGRENAGAVLDGSVIMHDLERGLTVLRVGTTATLIVPLQPCLLGMTVRIRVPADDLIIARDDPGETSAQNRLRARIRRIHEASLNEALVELHLQDCALIARVSRDTVRRLDLAHGLMVFVLLKSSAVQVLST